MDLVTPTAVGSFKDAVHHLAAVLPESSKGQGSLVLSEESTLQKGSGHGEKMNSTGNEWSWWPVSPHSLPTILCKVLVCN